MNETSHRSVPDSNEGDFRSYHEGNSTASFRSRSGRASSPATSGAPSSSSEMESSKCSLDTRRIPGGLDSTCCSGPQCRICYEGDEHASLLSFCACSGSIGFVHPPCLERWLNTKQTDTCEICRQRFPTVQSKRPLKQWIRIRVLACRKEDLFMHLVSVVLYTFITVFSLEQSVRVVSSSAPNWGQGATLLLLSGMLFGSFVALTYMTIKSYYMDFREWQDANLKVTLVWREESTA